MSAPTVNNGLEGLAEGPEGDTPMSFWDHLGELRSRLTRAALGVTVSVVLCFIYATELREFLAVPLHKAWVAANMPGKPVLQVLAMMDAFMTDMRVAMAGGIFLATPVLFYQFWMFIAPGLYAREKRYVIPFVATSVFMFLLGAAFCYYVVLPWTIQWLLSYTQSTSGAATAVVYNLTLNEYIRDATKILVAFGVVFEFPLLIAFLAFAGVLTHRSLLRFWKISVVMIFIIAAFLTPPEPVSQLMMAFPMVGLFFASVGIAYLIDKSKAKARALLARADEPDPADDAGPRPPPDDDAQPPP
ncbi:twin-arginine translocase subunit TatC [Nannocystis sp.]|uniref:twin-arginine translocase subunit TatC n=1 Tax=Nannocystis sp. TaxID=1962667 RepID=UPI0024274611|nr:twin-arginine translocase subunit TatC [Nannocystis sp.]MBK7830077.1 twin-arginine translocase subunit TatC [Nannocystis sp.]MBK9752056.1 twin-arginine translocase subunit TatC [Nannocystis sp.]